MKLGSSAQGACLDFHTHTHSVGATLLDCHLVRHIPV